MAQIAPPRMSPEEMLSRLAALKASDPEEYWLAMRLLQASEARQVPRTPVTPTPPSMGDSQK